MKVIIHTSFAKLYETEAKEVILPGEDGEFSVLDFHQPFIYSLKSGLLKIMPRTSNAKEYFCFNIKKGVAKIDGDNLTAMVELA